MDLCSAGGVTLSLGDGFTPQEEVTEVNILSAVMVNPRIPAAINTYFTSDNYFPEGKPLVDTLVRDGVAVLYDQRILFHIQAFVLMLAQAQTQTEGTLVLVKRQ